jgi:bifunctional non-homologous end joining protein LigD
VKDLFEEKQIEPMLIAENVPLFEDPEWLYELKWDGKRCLAYLDPEKGTELRDKRNRKVLPQVPELSEIHRQANERCILDGELICLIEGKPNFEAVQRRSLMSHPFKIEWESKRYPFSFVAFDCLYANGTGIMGKPLTDRKKHLERIISESERLAVSRTFSSGRAVGLFSLTQERELEGIVAKRQDSLYLPGTRTKSWKKIKNLLDDDYVICGWIPKENHMVSVILGQYREGRLTYKGHVTLGVGGGALAAVRKRETAVCPLADAPEGAAGEAARWVRPELVATVQFMYKTKNGGLRQPVFKGLREDKKPEECIDLG